MMNGYRIGLKRLRIAYGVVAVTGIVAHAAHAQPACVIQSQGEATGGVGGFLGLPTGETLVGADKGLFSVSPSSETATKIGGSEIGSIVSMKRVIDQGTLVSSGHGLFLLKDGNQVITKVNGAPDERFGAIQALSGGRFLTHSQGQIYEFDSRAGAAVAVGAGAINARAIYPTSGGNALISGSEGSWTWYDSSSRQIRPVRSDTPNRTFLEMVEILDAGSAVVGTNGGLFLFDPTALSLSQIGSMQVSALVNIGGHSVLVGSDEGLFIIRGVQSGPKKLEPTQAIGPVRLLRTLSNGKVLVAAERGLFLFTPHTEELVRAQGPAPENVFDIFEVSDRVLVVQARGWLIYNTGRNDVSTVSMLDERVVGAHAAGQGSVLIATRTGYYLVDVAQVKATRLPSPVPPVRGIDNIDLPPGSSVSTGPGGAFYFDPFIERQQPVPTFDSATEFHATYVQQDGSVLIAAGAGLFNVPATPIANGKVRYVSKLSNFQPLEDAVEIKGVFDHPCASMVEKLNLQAEATHREIRRSSPVRPSGTPRGRSTDVSFTLAFSEPGEWTLNLRQGDVVVDRPISFSISDRSFVAKVKDVWPLAALLIGLAEIISFLFLLYLTRTRPGAFRMLTDPGWSRAVTWPFLFVRHSAAIQRWFMQPWLNVERDLAGGGDRFLDPPVKSSTGETRGGTALLERLHTTRLIWLQGQSGMGKTSVFRSWQRTYFQPEQLLNGRSALAFYGFIMIGASLRHYADVPPPDNTRPESWVIEVVRRRLEQHGLATRDLGLIDALLRSGQVGLVFDGANEVDRDGCLEAFARQYETVRILVTSQNFGPDGWELWQLPTNIHELRRDLLVSWLGNESGEILDARIVSEGLADTLVSGYDLRLIADLAGSNPRSARIPVDRVALYREMLSAVRDEGNSGRLNGLKKLAWIMITERRREIVEKDNEVLGEQIMKSLASEGLRLLSRTRGIHEFRHDQMRAFLAAQWLTEESPTIAVIQSAVSEAKLFSMSRRDQEELWAFLAPMLATEIEFQALWQFTSEEPVERASLTAALQSEADRRGITLIRRARKRSGRRLRT